MKIGSKLVLSFSAVAIIGAIVGAVGFWGLGKTGSVIEALGGETLPAVSDALRIRNAASELKATQRTLLNVTVDPAERERLYANIAHDSERFHEAWNSYAAAPATPREREIWSRVEAIRAQWEADNNAFIEISSSFDELAKNYNQSKRESDPNYFAAMLDASALSQNALATFKTQV